MKVLFSSSLALVLVCAALANGYPHPYSSFSSSPRAVFPAPSAALPTSSGSSSSSSWCQPAQPCWPTPAQWASFNLTLGGALVQVTPLLTPCFPATSDPAACSAIVSNYTDSYFRASHPACQQEVNWEVDPVTGEGCIDASQPCLQGAVPPYAVAATSDAQLSAALAFAASHALRVVVKSSGHEYQGRSTGAAALLLWTHALQGVQVLPAYTACPATAPAGPAVLTHPGASWGEVYAAADAARVMVVGGSEVSVSSCGGYTLGGGHSWMGPAYGMAADNALRFTVVLADGSSVAASECESPELFWALRGGGGGTFGIVTSCTYAAHPYPAGGAAGAFTTVQLLQGPTSLVVLLDGFMAYAHTLSSAARSSSGVVAGGYFIPSLAQSQVTFLLGFNGTVQQASAALAPLSAWLATVPQYLTIASSSLDPFPSLMQFHEAFDSSSEATGNIATLGSRLIPGNLFLNDTARLTLAENLTEIAYATGGLTGMFVAGGRVAEPLQPGASSFTPAWRAAGFHVAFGAGWAANATLAQQAAVVQGVSSLTGVLRAATPGSGAYWSEADFLEPQWQLAFWGSNYERLQAVKLQVDPKGVFTCHHCVELPAV